MSVTAPPKNLKAFPIPGILLVRLVMSPANPLTLPPALLVTPARSPNAPLKSAGLKFRLLLLGLFLLLGLLEVPPVFIDPLIAAASAFMLPVSNVTGSPLILIPI